MIWQPAVPFPCRTMRSRPARGRARHRPRSECSTPGGIEAERAVAATGEKKPFYVRLVVDTQHVHRGQTNKKLTDARRVALHRGSPCAAGVVHPAAGW